MSRPRAARQLVLTGVFSAAVITYLDRVCMSVAAPAIREEFALSSGQFSLVFAIFNLAYAIFELPASWLGDRWGQRLALTRIVSGWSLFTIVTGLVPGYWSLVAARFCFGAAEASAFPTMSRTVARWFPVSERAWANGVMWTGSRIGGAFSPVLAVLLIAWAGWRATFVVFGVVGLVWSWCWFRWFRDDPADHPAVTPAELAEILVGAAPAPKPGTPLPWRALLGNKNLLGLFCSYFASGFGFQFFVTWLPTFLIQEHRVSLLASGFYTAAPLATGAIGCVFGGALADWLSRRLGSISKGRRVVATFGFTVGAAGLLLAMRAESPQAAVAWLSLATAAHDLTLSSVWASCTDIGGSFGGTAAGFVNLASSLSGIAAPIMAAWLASAFGSFSIVLPVAAGLYLAAAVLWQFIQAGPST